MCLLCGIPYCNCATSNMPPCNPCQEESGCNPKIKSNCVTINNIDLYSFFGCNEFLNYLYDCIVANPTKYTKFCQLWAACSLLCAAPTNLSIRTDVTGIEPDTVLFSWTQVATVTYDVYLDNVLIYSAATSPVYLSGLTGGNHTAKVVATCANAQTNESSINFDICTSASDFAVNVPLSNSTSVLVEWTELVGVVYDLYKNGVLVQTAATSPYVYTGLTPNTLYTFRIVSRCSGNANYKEINYTTIP